MHDSIFNQSTDRDRVEYDENSLQCPSTPEAISLVSLGRRAVLDILFPGASSVSSKFSTSQRLVSVLRKIKVTVSNTEDYIHLFRFALEMIVHNPIDGSGSLPSHLDIEDLTANLSTKIEVIKDLRAIESCPDFPAGGESSREMFSIKNVAHFLRSQLLISQLCNCLGWPQSSIRLYVSKKEKHDATASQLGLMLIFLDDDQSLFSCVERFLHGITRMQDKDSAFAMHDAVTSMSRCEKQPQLKVETSSLAKKALSILILILRHWHMTKESTVKRALCSFIEFLLADKAPDSNVESRIDTGLMPESFWMQLLETSLRISAWEYAVEILFVDAPTSFLCYNEPLNFKIDSPSLQVLSSSTSPAIRAAAAVLKCGGDTGGDYVGEASTLPQNIPIPMRLQLQILLGGPLALAAVQEMENSKIEDPLCLLLLASKSSEACLSEIVRSPNTFSALAGAATRAVSRRLSTFSRSINTSSSASLSSQVLDPIVGTLSGYVTAAFGAHSVDIFSTNEQPPSLSLALTPAFLVARLVTIRAFLEACELLWEFQALPKALFSLETAMSFLIDFISAGANSSITPASLSSLPEVNSTSNDNDAILWRSQWNRICSQAMSEIKRIYPHLIQ